MRYSFSVSGTSTVSLETKNTTGYTYMYLWSNTESRQISKNDDGGVGYEAKYFADNLDANQSIWESWKNANRSATRTVEHWLWATDVDLGEISSIYIVSQKRCKIIR